MDKQQSQLSGAGVENGEPLNASPTYTARRVRLRGSIGIEYSLARYGGGAVAAVPG